jgi:hypothetical protein
MGIGILKECDINYIVSSQKWSTALEKKSGRELPPWRFALRPD